MGTRSIALRGAGWLVGVGGALGLLLAASPTGVVACSYVPWVQFVGFRGTLTDLTQDSAGTYDVDFVVSEVFQGVVPHHVKVRFVPAAHLDYVHMSLVDVHAIENRGEFDWQGPCDSADISTTPFVGVGYAPAPDPPIPSAAHGAFVPVAVLGGLVLVLGTGYLAVRRSG